MKDLWDSIIESLKWSIPTDKFYISDLIQIIIIYSRMNFITHSSNAMSFSSNRMPVMMSPSMMKKNQRNADMDENMISFAPF